MRPTRLILAVGLAALVTAPALGQAGPVAPIKEPTNAVSQPAKNGNAAVDYWRAAALIDPAFTEKVSNIDWKAIGSGTDLKSMPADVQALAKDIPSPLITSLIRGSKTPRCDFQVEYDLGPFALLPHLGKMRAIARIARFDARVKLASGNPAGAAEDLAAIVRMGGHLGNDQLLISSLVSAAILNLACSEVQAELESGKLTPDAKATMLAAFNNLDKSDPCSIKPCVRGEQRWCLDWIKANFRGDTAGKQLIATNFLAGEHNGAEAGAGQTIAVMNGDQLSMACDILSPYYDQVLAVWDKPDAPDQLKALSEKAAHGDYGPLGVILAPAFNRAVESTRKISAEINKTRDLLSK